MRKFLLSFCSLTLLAGCAGGTSPSSDMQTVIMHTSMGDITLEIHAEAAPKTAENFVTHAKNGYYDNLTFHRVIPEFMIQGGDPSGNGTGGESIWGGKFEDEINAETYGLHRTKLSEVTNQQLPPEMADMNVKEYYEKYEGYTFNDDLKSLPMERGYLAMANGGPNTNGSQFFIITREEGTSWLEGKHTVFGRVTEGMDIVDAISNVERDERDMPLEPVTFTMEVVN